MQATERRKAAAPGGFLPPSNRVPAMIQRSPDSRFNGDFSGVPASHHRQFVTPKHDDQKIRIAAVPDILLSGFTPIKVDVEVKDADVSTIEWQLIAPAGNVVAGSTVATKKGDADALTRSFTIQRVHLGDAGKYHLQCSGLDDKGISRVYATRGFSVVTAPMSTGVWRHGRFGAMVFREYLAVTPSDGSRPWVHVELAFLPTRDVECDNVMFVQAVQVLSPDGRRLHDTVSKDLGPRASSQGWSIDQDEGVESPYYIVGKNLKGKEVPQLEQGRVGRGGPNRSETSLFDQPNTNQAMVTHFETCAVCAAGDRRRQVYGCATWGFSYIDGKMTTMPRDFHDEPSEEFHGAAAGWSRVAAEKRAAAGGGR